MDEVWLRRMADLEDKYGPPLAGGLAADLGFLQHITNGSCWCEPEVTFVAEDGSRIYCHRERH